MRNSITVPVLRKSTLLTFLMRRSTSPAKQMTCHVKMTLTYKQMCLTVKIVRWVLYVGCYLIICDLNQ